MNTLNNVVVHFVDFELVFPKAMQELIDKAVEAWLELEAAWVRLSEIIQRERNIWSIAEAGINGFIEKGTYIGNESDRLPLVPTENG